MVRQVLLTISFSIWALLTWTGTAVAHGIMIHIDISEQKMQVRQGPEVLHEWPVSTARPGKRTPVGSFTPYLMKRKHFSSLYNNAPMPYSIFFDGNYAIHGTNQISRLGTPASAGCIRLHPDHAALLFEKVLAVGKTAARVIIRD